MIDSKDYKDFVISDELLGEELLWNGYEQTMQHNLN